MKAIFLQSHPCLSSWRRGAALASAAFACVVLAPISATAVTTDIAAVYSATGNSYQRVKLPDGSYKPETYTFAEGGRWDGTIVDKSLDDLSFVKVAKVVSDALRTQNYVMSADPKQIELMVMVFWGTTTGAEDGRFRNHQQDVFSALSRVNAAAKSSARGWAERMARNGANAEPWSLGDAEKMMGAAATDELAQMLMMNQAENAMREHNNVQNAVILGFWDDYNKARDLPTFAFSNSIIEELEANRYFVVLKVYDFQLLRTQKVKKLLWESRFSIRERGNRFDDVLPAMAMRASKYFGQNSKRLLREVVPIGRVEVGTPVVLPHQDERK